MVGFCTRSLPCSLRLPFIPPTRLLCPPGRGHLCSTEHQGRPGVSPRWGSGPPCRLRQSQGQAEVKNSPQILMAECQVAFLTHGLPDVSCRRGPSPPGPPSRDPRPGR